MSLEVSIGVRFNSIHHDMGLKVILAGVRTLASSLNKQWRLLPNAPQATSRVPHTRFRRGQSWVGVSTIGSERGY